jgi:ATP synthase protein I
MPSNDARMLRGAALAAAPAGILAVILCAVIAGSKGLVGGLVGVALVFLFFGLGLAALARLTRDHPQVALTAGLLVYALQVLGVGVVIVVFKHTTLFNGKAFAWTVLATALAWIGGQVYWTLKGKYLYVDPGRSS